MNNGIYFGAVSAESVKAQSDAIMQILSAPHADEKTKQLALKVLGKGVSAPSHNSLNGCNISNDESTHIHTNGEA